MHKLTFRLILFCFLVLFFSCNKLSKKNTPMLTDTMLAKKIMFPAELKILKAGEFQDTNQNLKNVNHLRIISIVDGACMKCIINQLNYTDIAFNSFTRKDKDLIFILNVSSNDSSFFMNNLYPSIETESLILWDNNFNFERTNKLFTSNFNLRTFMIDSNNQIIHYGNPVMNPEEINTYKQKYLKHTK